jgi:hypothetical protein
MQPMYVESHLRILESLNAEVKPTFRVALPISSFTVARSPKRVLIVTHSRRLRQVARVEIAVKHYFISEVVEFESVFVRDVGELVGNHARQFYTCYNFINKHHRRPCAGLLKFS